MRHAILGFVLSLACAVAHAENHSDIWWNPAESGWGLTLADHGTNLFGVWYTYRADGKPVWYTIPGGTFSSDGRTFTGDVYVSHGPSYTLAQFDASQVASTKVGSATIDFAPAGQPAGSALFNIAVNGVTKTSRIERMPFGNAAPAWGADATDLWFNPAESGWGVALAQHGNNVFGVWFTYDTDGQPLWLAVPGVQFTSPGAFSGKLYMTSGPYYGNAMFDASAVKVREAGTAAFDVNLAAGATAQCGAGAASFSVALDANAGGVQYQRTACTMPFGVARPVSGNVALQPKTCSGTYTVVAVEPSGCMYEGMSHTYSGTLTLQGIDWTRAGPQSGSLTLTDLPMLYMPVGSDDMMMMGDMMMGMYGTGMCVPRTVPTLTLPLDFTLASAVHGLQTSGAINAGLGNLTYDVSVTDTSVSGHVAYTGGAYYTAPFTQSGTFSCSVK